MGYYVINNLIKERINKMSKETLRKTVNTITHLDSMKAVKVAHKASFTDETDKFDALETILAAVGKDHL